MGNKKRERRERLDEISNGTANYNTIKREVQLRVNTLVQKWIEKREIDYKKLENALMNKNIIKDAFIQTIQKMKEKGLFFKYKEEFIEKIKDDYIQDLDIDIDDFGYNSSGGSFEL
jgi:hypothetical protein